MIEDRTNLWIVHPIAEWLLPWALRARIHPNLVSLTGMGCGLAAGWCYFHWREPGFVVAGLLFMIAWHVFDGLDGKVARASGKQSALGRLMDGLCDYVVFISVYLALVLSFDDWRPVLALAVASGAAHAVQSAWYEGERDSWKRRARGEFALPTQRQAHFWGERLYNWAESLLSSGGRATDSALAAAPGKQQAYLDGTAPMLRGLALFSANNRTLGIALAAFIGNPLIFWYWELLALSFLALLMAMLLRRRERASVAR